MAVKGSGIRKDLCSTSLFTVEYTAVFELGHTCIRASYQPAVGSAGTPTTSNQSAA